MGEVPRYGWSVGWYCSSLEHNQSIIVGNMLGLSYAKLRLSWMEDDDLI